MTRSQESHPREANRNRPQATRWSKLESWGTNDDSVPGASCASHRASFARKNRTYSNPCLYRVWYPGNSAALRLNCFLASHAIALRAASPRKPAPTPPRPTPGACHASFYCGAVFRNPFLYVANKFDLNCPFRFHSKSQCDHADESPPVSESQAIVLPHLRCQNGRRARAGLCCGGSVVGTAACYRPPTGDSDCPAGALRQALGQLF